MRAVVGASALDPRGPIADAIVDLWWLMLALGAAVFVVFAVLLVMGLRREAPDDEADEARHRDLVRRWIGAGGVAMPALVIVVVFAATLQTMREVPERASGDALEVEVIGHQWWYEVRYPDEGVVTANEIHVPVGRDLAFTLLSEDVIHSFWIRELGGKLDMLPERANRLILHADEPGEYRSRCAEFCGLQHAKMGLVVIAEPATDFAAWIEQHRGVRETGNADTAEGRGIFLRAGCVECHALRGDDGGESRGPDLTDLPMRTTLGAMPLPNTRENLAAWISDPHQFKKGVSMPATPLRDDELDALVDYLTATR